MFLLLCTLWTFKNEEITGGVKGLLRSSLFPSFHSSFLPAIILPSIERSHQHTCKQWLLTNFSFFSNWPQMTLCYSLIPVTGPVYCLFSNSYNSLTEVEGSEFKSLRQLEMLMLHGNDINTVHPGAFYSLRSVQVVYVWECTCPGNLTTVPIFTYSKCVLDSGLVCMDKGGETKRCFMHNIWI